MDRIESESRFLLKFFWRFLLSPFTLILVLIGKRQWKYLFEPFRMIFEFIFAPRFTIAIIGLNVLAFFWSLMVPESVILGLINYPADMLGVRFFTLFTSGFLHAGIAHLVGNMIGIFIFGRVVERKIGAYKTGLVYFGALLLSGVFSSLIDLSVGSTIGGLGASGALMGLVATAILYDPFYLSYELLLPIPVMFLGWLSIYADISGVINPSESGIGHFAHIGGFLSIAVIMYMLGVEERSKLKRGLIINVVSFLVGVALFFLLV